MSMLTRALLAALTALLFFALKAVSIASGRDAYEDPLVNVFFYLGIASLLVTFVVAGAALGRRPSRWPRALRGALGLGIGIVVGVGLAAVITALLPNGGSWVWAEVNLWVISALTVVTLLVLRSRQLARP